MSLFSISPSPFSCLTHLLLSPYDDSLSLDFPVHTFLPYLHVLKHRACASPHEDEKFGYLAKSALNTGYEPNEFGTITSVDSDTMLIDEPDLNEISDFSKNTYENIGLFGVLTMFESSDSHVFHDDLLFK